MTIWVGYVERPQEMNVEVQNVSVGTELRSRGDIHLARRAFHSIGVAIVIAFYMTLSRQAGLVLLGTVIMIAVPFDFIRQSIPAVNKAFVSALKIFMRREETNHLTGVSYLLVGCFIIIYLFPKEIVTLSLILLAVGDPACSIAGTLYGKDKLLGNKSLQGSLAGLIVCTIASSIYFMYTGLMTERLVLVSLLAGVVGAVSELIPVGKLDDNFTFPIICSVLLYGLFLLFGGF